MKTPIISIWTLRIFPHIPLLMQIRRLTSKLTHPRRPAHRNRNFGHRRLGPTWGHSGFAVGDLMPANQRASVGELWMWGLAWLEGPRNPQIGAPKDVKYSTIPRLIEGGDLNDEDEIEFISCGSRHTLVATKRKVFSFGSNAKRQCGFLRDDDTTDDHRSRRGSQV